MRDVVVPELNVSIMLIKSSVALKKKKKDTQNPKTNMIYTIIMERFT